MSKLSEFHSKNSFEYVSFLITNLIEIVEVMESEYSTFNVSTSKQIEIYES